MTRNRRPRKQRSDDQWEDEQINKNKKLAEGVQNFVPATQEQLAKELEQAVDSKTTQEEIDKTTYIKNEYDFMLINDELLEDISYTEPLHKLIVELSHDWEDIPDPQDVQKIIDSLYEYGQDTDILRQKVQYILGYTQLTDQWRTWFERRYIHISHLFFYQDNVLEEILETVGMRELYDMIQRNGCSDQSVQRIVEWAETYGLDIGALPEMGYTVDYHILDHIYEIDYILTRILSFPRSQEQRIFLESIKKAFPDPLLREILIRTEEEALRQGLASSDYYNQLATFSAFWMMFRNQIDLESMYDFHLRQVTSLIRDGKSSRSIIENILSYLGPLERDYEEFDTLVETIGEMKIIYDQYKDKTFYLAIMPNMSKNSEFDTVGITFKRWNASEEEIAKSVSKISQVSRFWKEMQKNLKEERGLEVAVVRSLPSIEIEGKTELTTYNETDAHKSIHAHVQEKLRQLKKERREVFGWFEKIKEDAGEKLMKGIGVRHAPEMVEDLESDIFPDVESVMSRVFEIIRYGVFAMIGPPNTMDSLQVVEEIYHRLTSVADREFIQNENVKKYLEGKVGSSDLHIEYVDIDTGVYSIPFWEYVQVEIIHHGIVSIFDKENVSFYFDGLLKNEIIHTRDGLSHSYFDIACKLGKREFASNMLAYRHDLDDFRETPRSVDRTKTTNRLQGDFTQEKLKFLKENFEILDYIPDTMSKGRKGKYLTLKKDIGSRKDEAKTLDLYDSSIYTQTYKKETMGGKQLRSIFPDYHKQKGSGRSIVHNLIQDNSLPKKEFGDWLAWLRAGRILNDKSLDDRNGNENHPTRYYRTPLQRAFLIGNYDGASAILESLITNGKKIDLCEEIENGSGDHNGKLGEAQKSIGYTGKGKSLIHMVASHKDKNRVSNIVKLLLEYVYSADPKQLVDMGQLDRVKHLLAHKDPEFGLTGLQMLAKYNHIALVEELIKKYDAYIRCWSSDNPRSVMMKICASDVVSLEILKRFDGQYQRYAKVIGSTIIEKKRSKSRKSKVSLDGDWHEILAQKHTSKRKVDIGYHPQKWLRMDNYEKNIIVPRSLDVDGAASIDETHHIPGWVLQRGLIQSVIESGDHKKLKYILDKGDFNPKAEYLIDQSKMKKNVNNRFLKIRLGDGSMEKCFELLYSPPEDIMKQGEQQMLVWQVNMREMVKLLRNADQKHERWYEKNLDKKTLEQVRKILEQGDG